MKDMDQRLACSTGPNTLAQNERRRRLYTPEGDGEQVDRIRTTRSHTREEEVA